MYAEFSLEIPTSLPDLLKALAKDAAARTLLLAGGTVSLVDIRSGKEQPNLLLSLDRIGELRGIRQTSGGLVIGARTTVTELLASPLIAGAAPSLASAARVFAGQMVRNAATLGGNVACGSPAADLVPPLLSLDAEVELISASGKRQVALAGYYTGYKKDVRRPDEVIASIILPKPPAGSSNTFYKLARRKGDAITVTGVAVSLAVEHGKCSHVRIALGSVSPAPMRASKAEAVLRGQRLSPGLLEEAGAVAMSECSPIDDVRATAGYRRKMVKVLTTRLLMQAFEKNHEGGQ